MFGMQKARGKGKLMARSDMYRKYLARKILGDLPRFAKDTWEDFDPDDVLRYAGLTTYKPAKASFGGVGIFLIGAACGGIAALLFAPRPGAEMRSTVKDKALGYIKQQNIGVGTEKQASA